ncbi:MAG: sodium:calcium antiporter [Rhodovibrionaceae bacterium]|nr:sodium:calcium antiporter [Rhodovibrionaceae bacterium]
MTPILGEIALSYALPLFVASSLVILTAGTLLARVAQRLAHLTGIGQALMGAVFLGGTTSLPGIIAATTSAWQGHAELAMNTAVGGIAVQTAFLAIADMAYRKANLEHAAAAPANLMQGSLLVTLLALPLLASAVPEPAILGVHPISLMMIAGYIFGLKLISVSVEEPMWAPRQTRETHEEGERERRGRQKDRKLLWLQFALLALVVAGAGYLVAQSGIAISRETGLSESAVGAVFVAVSTSLPELVTAVAAVRRGALTLAVGDVLGGNCFDILLVSLADIAYRQGSVYAAISVQHTFVLALSILLAGILLMGLLRRERYGIGRIGFESFLVLILYLGGMAFFLSTS